MTLCNQLQPRWSSTSFHSFTRSDCAVSSASTSPSTLTFSIVSPCWIALTTSMSDASSTSPNTLCWTRPTRSEEHTSELQSLMRISYAVFCLTKKKQNIKLLYSTYQHTHTKPP